MFNDLLILVETFLWISFGHITFQTGDMPPGLPCLPGLSDPAYTYHREAVFQALGASALGEDVPSGRAPSIHLAPLRDHAGLDDKHGRCDRCVTKAEHLPQVFWTL